MVGPPSPHNWLKFLKVDNGDATRQVKNFPVFNFLMGTIEAEEVTLCPEINSPQGYW